MIIVIIILILIYPFLLHFQLNTFKKKLTVAWQEIASLLENYKNTPSDEVAEKIHQKRRAYNALVRANNHKLNSNIAQFLAKKYNFVEKELFKFQGR
jgi:hypothetical protein